MSTKGQPADEGAPASWEFAGWGKAERILDLKPGPTQVRHLDQEEKHMLGTWRSTAICGNDISSSVLYVSALCAAQAGALAPVVLVIVAVVLYFYRRVYAEVGSALPLNGGTYTVLLNTTNKQLAAGAACLTLLSYIATAVISANEAMHYAHNMFAGLNIISATVALLGIFAVLNILGITESAVVALGIFIVHLVTLTVLSVTATIAVVEDPSMLFANWTMPDPSGIGHALFFGFAAAMLGISGFESSANFIEEQQSGVFPKTLRNMWLVVAIFNPLISLLSLGLLPLATIREVPPDLLADMGARSAGDWLRLGVSMDAVLVLSGAVLTSYVGVTGLVRRMSLDRCLPQFLLRENTWRKTNHWIILSFFGLCTSILFVTGGKIETLAGVYTLSFLSVMALFAIGNMLLKRSRGRLPREVRASWPTVTLALIAVLIGLVGNIVLDPRNVEIFVVYFMVAAAIVGVMFLRIQLLRLGLVVSRSLVEWVNKVNEWIRESVTGKINDINSRAVVYFTKNDDAAALNRVALYVLKNEQTSRLQVVHLYDDEEDIPSDLARSLRTVDHLYPQLRIDFLAVKGTFGPETIEQLSQRLDVPKNYMFISTPGDHFPYRIEKLGGVRVIL
ncbi:MAG: APC family permease [Rhodothermales bacterium]